MFTISTDRNDIFPPDQQMNTSAAVIGDVSERRELRRRLQCHSFAWFLQNVLPEIHIPADRLAHGPVSVSWVLCWLSGSFWSSAGSLALFDSLLGGSWSGSVLIAGFSAGWLMVRSVLLGFSVGWLMGRSVFLGFSAGWLMVRVSISCVLCWLAHGPVSASWVLCWLAHGPVSVSWVLCWLAHGQGQYFLCSLLAGSWSGQCFLGSLLAGSWAGQCFLGSLLGGSWSGSVFLVFSAGWLIVRVSVSWVLCWLAARRPSNSQGVAQ